MNDELKILEAQQNIHELIAQHYPLHETLGAITAWLGLMMPGALLSIMRFNAASNTLSLIANDLFSERYIARMQNVPVASGAGTCGSAAFEQQPVVTEDIQKDARWEDFRAAAQEEKLRACWSMPVVVGAGELLGTFATYYRAPRSPTESEQRCLERGAALTALAILRDRDAQNHSSLSEWHRTLFENIPEGVFTFDLEGKFLSCNAALERITGYTQDTLLGLHFNQFVEQGYQEQTQARFDEARRGGSTTYETMGIHALGHAYHLEVTNFPVVIAGEIVGVYGVCRDVSERKQQDADLRLLKRGIEASPHGITLLDANQPDLPIVYANSAFTEITGYLPEEVLGRNCRFLQGEETDAASIEHIRAALDSQTDVDVALRNYRKDGTPFWNHLRVSPVTDNQGKCTHFIGIQQDITRQKEQEARITYQATHDLVTGLLNHAAFFEKLNDALQERTRYPGNLVALSLELDGFKAINDELEHHIGNGVLVTVARRLESMLDSEATLGRLIGGEFGILLSGHDSRGAVIQLAERILEKLAKPMDIDGRMIRLSASIGIATSELSLKMPHELMQYAGVALERARRQGHDTWQWYHGNKTEIESHSVALRHDLHSALEEGQLELHYQPLVDAISGRMCSAEALVRWRHPSRGMVSPGEFIPLAEQTGQIVAVGRWILKQACHEMAGFNDQRERPLPVAVNISSLQFNREGFFEEVQKVLKETGLPPHLLELEVTESVLLDDTETVIELMRKLKAMGVGVALDDFGTGYSSLSYLRDLPTNKIKLDRSFIREATTDRHVAAIVEGVITIAHHMDMCVVAEGVETPQQQEYLASRHCDLLQGYFFARPMPLSALRSLPDLLPAYRPE